MNILCLDFGTKRIGVAFASTPIAEPLEIIPNSRKTTDQVASVYVIRRILQLIELYKVDKIVVGLSESAMAQLTQRFIEQLQQQTSQPIEEMDETLSTFDATAKMKTMKKSKREGDRDHYAAATILQNYLDVHNENALV